jgi:hypothetical protein
MKCFKNKRFGTPGWDRTNDLRLRSPLLYPLSYRGMFAIIAENKKTLHKSILRDALQKMKSELLY